MKLQAGILVLAFLAAARAANPNPGSSADADTQQYELLREILRVNESSGKKAEGFLECMANLLGQQLDSQPQQAGSLFGGHPGQAHLPQAPSKHLHDVLVRLYPVVSKYRKCGGCCTCAAGNTCAVMLFAELEQMAGTQSNSVFGARKSNGEAMARIFTCKDKDVVKAVSMAIDSCVDALCGQCQFCVGISTNYEAAAYLLMRKMKMANASTGSGGANGMMQMLIGGLGLGSAFQSAPEQGASGILRAFRANPGLAQASMRRLQEDPSQFIRDVLFNMSVPATCPTTKCPKEVASQDEIYGQVPASMARRTLHPLRDLEVTDASAAGKRYGI